MFFITYQKDACWLTILMHNSVEAKNLPLFFFPMRIRNTLLNTYSNLFFITYLNSSWLLHFWKQFLSLEFSKTLFYKKTKSRKTVFVFDIFRFPFSFSSLKKFNKEKKNGIRKRLFIGNEEGKAGKLKTQNDTIRKRVSKIYQEWRRMKSSL